MAEDLPPREYGIREGGTNLEFLYGSPIHFLHKTIRTSFCRVAIQNDTSKSESQQLVPSPSLLLLLWLLMLLLLLRLIRLPSLSGSRKMFLSPMKKLHNRM